MARATPPSVAGHAETGRVSAAGAKPFPLGMGLITQLALELDHPAPEAIGLVGELIKLLA